MTQTYKHNSVFPPKGGTMALPNPSVLLPHTLILKFMLENTVLHVQHWNIVDLTSCNTDALLHNYYNYVHLFTSTPSKANMGVGHKKR